MMRRGPLLGAAIRILQGPCKAPPRWREHIVMFRRAHFLVQVFYAVTMFQLYTAANSLSQPAVSIESMDLLWPVWWLNFTGIKLGGWILGNLVLAAGLAGFLMWRCLPVRILVSFALLEHAAFVNSFGAINHSNHEWFWISVCFWLLPSASGAALKASRTLRMQFLLALSGATALILMFYSMSGLWKCLSATVSLMSGQFGGFSPDAMAVTVATRALLGDSDPLWTGLLLDHPKLGWPLYLSLYYVELVAIAIIFRPGLLRVWGVILIFFHFGTQIFMDIVFPTHVLINAMLFVMSPFALRDANWHNILAALPLFGGPVRALTGWSAVPQRLRTPDDAGPAA